MRSFVKIKPSRIGDITLSFTDISKSCIVRDFFYVASVSFNAIRENKILAKISEFTVLMEYSFRFDTISLEWSTVFIEGHVQCYFQIK